MSDFKLNQCKTLLREVDYNHRLTLIYQWCKTDHVDKSTFIKLVNFSIDLDLLPSDEQ